MFSFIRTENWEIKNYCFSKLMEWFFVKTIRFQIKNISYDIISLPISATKLSSYLGLFKTKYRTITQFCTQPSTLPLLHHFLENFILLFRSIFHFCRYQKRLIVRLFNCKMFYLTSLMYNTIPVIRRFLHFFLSSVFLLIHFWHYVTKV